MSVTEKKILKLPILAAIVGLIGLSDATYLTIKHYTETPVPCNILEGCEVVLTSAYANLWGIPLAVFGALAYLAAIVLAVLSIRGNRLTWGLYTAQAAFMAAFSVWLLYVQAFILGAFCQFCLLSAAVSLTLFIIALISLFRRSKFA